MIANVNESSKETEIKNFSGKENNRWNDHFS
jgi:hypothetical protein